MNGIHSSFTRTHLHSDRRIRHPSRSTQKLLSNHQNSAKVAFIDVLKSRCFGFGLFLRVPVTGCHHSSSYHYFPFSSFVFRWRFVASQTRCNAFCCDSSISISGTSNFFPFCRQSLKRCLALRKSHNGRQVSKRVKMKSEKMKGKSAFVLTVKIYWPHCSHMFPLILQYLQPHNVRQVRSKERENDSLAMAAQRRRWMHRTDEIIRSHQLLLLSMLFVRYCVVLVSHFIQTLKRETAERSSRWLWICLMRMCSNEHTNTSRTMTQKRAFVHLPDTRTTQNYNPTGSADAGLNATPHTETISFSDVNSPHIKIVCVSLQQRWLLLHRWACARVSIFSLQKQFVDMPAEGIDGVYTYGLCTAPTAPHSRCIV